MVRAKAEPRNLLEAVRYFSDPDRALAWAVKFRWADGKPVCPSCGCLEHSFLKTRRIWKCLACKRQYSVKVGTVFEDSPIGLDKWLPALWLVANSKNGISSHEMGRALGVTQKTAWFINHRIRLAMRQGTIAKLSGEVEVDETFVGGLAKFMHRDNRAKLRGTGGMDKTMVVGVLERGQSNALSHVTASVETNRDSSTLQPLVHRTVAVGSTVYTDALPAYRGLDGLYFTHQFIDHAVKYVEGRIHTNGLENFWTLLKRGIKGTYVCPQPWHLHRYVDERVFTFNHREAGDLGRMQFVMSGAKDKRVTYAELTGHAA